MLLQRNSHDYFVVRIILFGAQNKYQRDHSNEWSSFENIQLICPSKLNFIWPNGSENDM